MHRDIDRKGLGNLHDWDPNAISTLSPGWMKHQKNNFYTITHILQVQWLSVSGTTEKFIVHNEATRFMFNTHALHNTHLIRAALPCNLTVPLPYAFDRMAHHHVLSSQYWEWGYVGRGLQKSIFAVIAKPGVGVVGTWWDPAAVIIFIYFCSICWCVRDVTWASKRKSLSTLCFLTGALSN
jgi:hypothetical protein